MCDSWEAELSDQFFRPANARSRKFLGWVTRLGAWCKPEGYWNGGVGRAYRAGPSHVVKITTDKNEAATASLLVGKHSPHFAYIYDVRDLGSHYSARRGGEIRLYGIVQERLNPCVSCLYRAAGNAVYDYMDHNPGPVKDVKKAWEGSQPFLSPRLKTRARPAVLSILTAINEIYQQFGIVYADSHGANLAFKNRQVAFFDWGRSSLKELPSNLTIKRL